MEVLRQTCKACGSTSFENILMRERGRAEMVIVRCVTCQAFVARYRLQAYYHHDAGIESFLRSIGVEASDSGRSQLAEFKQVEEEAVAQFDRVVAALEGEDDVQE